MEQAESVAGDVVLDALDVALHGARGKAEEFEEFGEGFVTLADAGGEFFPVSGEGEPAIGDVIEETELGQALDHEGDGGAADVELFGDVADADKALAGDDVGDGLEVILHALGGPAAMVGAELFARTRGGVFFRRHEKLFLGGERCLAHQTPFFKAKLKKFVMPTLDSNYYSQ